MSVPLNPTNEWSRSNQSPWTVRLIADPVVALRNFQSDIYWNSRAERGAVFGDPLTMRDVFERWKTGQGAR